MNTHDNNLKHDERLDLATADRLAKLRTMPVDTSGLEQFIHTQIPPVRRQLSARRIWFRPMRAVAAVLLVTGIVGAVLLTNSGGRALASPTQMAQMHDDIVSGRTPVMQVGSIFEANKALLSQWPDSPGIPAMAADHVMACCMKSVKNKKVACVLLKSEGEPMTMTVANASDMKMPTSPTALRDGVTYHVQSAGTLNMVMTERHERWICLIGRLPAAQLMDVAAKLQF
jgi:hypothetical protein